MKVQIEISKKAAMMATTILFQAAETGEDQELLNKAIARCKEEVTEVSFEDAELGEAEDLVACAFFMAAVAKRGKEIEEEGKE